MTGPFFVKDKDFRNCDVFVPAQCCKECAFFDEGHKWCPMDPCLYFEGIRFGENEESDSKE